MVLGLLFLSVHPHHLSHFRGLGITTYRVLIWTVRESLVGTEIPESRELLGCPVPPGGLVKNMLLEYCHMLKKGGHHLKLDSLLNIVS